MKRMLSVFVAIVLMLTIVQSSLAIERQDFYIDPRLESEEKEIMRRIMMALEPADRENVIYVDENRKIYANRMELKDDLKKLTRLNSSQYIDQEGNIITLPEQNEKTDYRVPSVFGDLPTSSLLQSSSCGNENSGPYRRFLSKAGTTSSPNAWVSTMVYLPSKTNDINANNQSANGDTAHIYLGGSPAQGRSVDAGVFHSSTYDNWAAFIKDSGVSNPYTYVPRYSSNQTINMKFHIPQDNQVALTISGTNVNGVKTTTTWVENVNGWKSNGVGNTMKRVTSIAQKPQNLNNGSYLKNVRWSQTLIGKSSSSNHTWAAGDTAGSCYYPNDSSVFSINYINQANETVNIVIPN